MKHTYICTAFLKDGTEIGELFKTDSSRKSKVVKLIDEAFMKKYGMKFTSLSTASINKLDKHFKIETK